MSIMRRLSELHIDLPTVPTPVANYVPTRQSGSLVFTSGKTSTKDGVLKYPGKLGLDVTVEEGQQAAELAALNCLAALQAHLGSLDRITAIINLTGYVASTHGFADQPTVINGASLLLERIFGEIGSHSRAALGVAELPGGAAVEVTMVVEATQPRGRTEMAEIS
jgi:enamine deaminase RidA (YjgF/YER057c/UK114 family)